MLGLRRLFLVVLVALLASCAEPWEATKGLVPVASPSTPPPSAVAGPPDDPVAPAAIEPVSACSLIGVRITADRGDAAMGYREMGLHVQNCGTGPYQVRGRPDIVVLDEDGRPLKVSVVASAHYTAAPTRLVLKPGASALAVLSWRNTVTNTNGSADNGAALAVAMATGGVRQLVTLPAPLDLGNTGRLETSAWF